MTAPKYDHSKSDTSSSSCFPEW